MKIEISLGSNTQPAANMRKAKDLLLAVLPNIAFGEVLWTKPYATPLVPHPTTPYLNCMATADTTLTLSYLNGKFKQIEQSMGDCHENHTKGIVIIDIDLLKYGDTIIKEKLW